MWVVGIRRFSLHDPLLNQLVEGMEIKRSIAIRFALNLCKVVLEGNDLGLELLDKQP